MRQNNTIYDKIQELLGIIPGNVTILEQQIDAAIQFEYYNYTKKLNGSFNPEEVLKNKESVFRDDLTIKDKKYLLVQLANIDSIEAYRTLEKYIQDSNDNLKDWATLALQECKLLLESKLLDKSQVLISTGLGGKGLKLRYFTVLFASRGTHYSEFEKKIVTEEIRYFIKKSKGELEQLHFDDELCTILSIIPLQIPVQDLFDDLINECNQYGSFINTEYVITNVRILTNNQIRKMIGKTLLHKKTRKD